MTYNVGVSLRAPSKVGIAEQTTPTVDVEGDRSGPPGTTPTSPFTLTAHNADETPLTLVATSPQNADLFDVKNASLQNVMSVDATGALSTKRTYIGPPSIDATPLTVYARSGATTSLMELFDSAGNKAVYVGPDGTFYGKGLNSNRLGVSSAAPTFGGGAGPMIFLGDDTSDPTTNPVGGVILYSRGGGFFRARHPNGTVMTLAPTLSTTGTELLLEQTGDTIGTTRLHLQNRGGAAGALFENPAIDLVDFGFKPQITAQANFRLEGRNASLVDGGNQNTVGEFQLILNALGTFAFGGWFGKVGAGVSGRLAVGGIGSYGSGAGPMLFLHDDTSDPTTNPAAGTILYSAAGVLKARTSDGTVTTIAPPAVARQSYVSGRWYTAPCQPSTSSRPNGYLTAIPFAVDRPLTITALGIEVTTVGNAGAVLRLGVYADSGGQPGTLLVDGGTVAADTTGVKTLAITPLALPVGFVYLAACPQNAATTVPSTRAAIPGTIFRGSPSSTAGGFLGAGWSYGFAGQAGLPNPLPIGSNTNPGDTALLVSVQAQ